MSSFSEQERNLPPSNVVVPPDAFSSKWTDRPEEPVCIGLRFVPDGELEDARIEAYRRASKLFPDHERSEEATTLWCASFLDGLMRWVIARGTCDPNNVNAAWELWAAAPEDICVELALTDHGAQMIYDAWERMRIAANIGLSAATDEDLALLPALLLRLPRLRATSPTAELRLRRLLRFVLEALEEVEPESPSPGAKASQGPNTVPETALSPAPAAKEP